MRKGFLAAAAAALAVAAAAPAFAGDTSSPVIERRQRNQQGRIIQGIRSGEVTPGEAARLEREQVRTERMERRMKADGVFTPGERARVQHRQNTSSRHIGKARHNDRKVNP